MADHHHARVVVSTERPVDDMNGLLYDGVLNVLLDPDKESLASAVVRTLQENSIDVQVGDMLFFPLAASGHRMARVTGRAAR